MIIKCDNKKCIHRFQDVTYGKGRRVHNFAPKVPGHRCTVCGNTVGKTVLRSVTEEV